MANNATFYYDFGSPYAYLAAERIDGLIPYARWKPIAFPILLAQLGRLESVLERDFKAALEAAAPRGAERGLPPLEPPEGWPVSTWSLAPLRAALFADEQGRVKEFSNAAFRKVFVESRSLAEADNLRAAAGEAGLDPDEIDDAIQRPDVKQRLKDNTEEARAKGVTGIPTVLVGGDLYWGDDRLEEAAAVAGR